MVIAYGDGNSPQKFGTCKIISTAWKYTGSGRISIVDWFDIPKYNITVRSPNYGELVKLESHLQVGGSKATCNVWFRWSVDTTPISGGSTKTNIVRNNSLPDGGIGSNRFRSAFGCQLSSHSEATIPISNISFHLIDEKFAGHVHKFNLQCKLTDGSDFCINRIWDEVDASWNSYMTSSISAQVYKGIKNESEPFKMVVTYSDDSDYKD